MATGSELIRVEHVTKKFKGGVVALNDCSISISRGEVVAIIGPSGSGKSTLLRCLNLLETPSSGRIFFDGVDITGKRWTSTCTAAKWAWCSSTSISSRTRP